MANNPQTPQATAQTAPPTAAELPPLPEIAGRPYNVDLADLGRQDPHYRFAHAYLYGPHALDARNTYALLYPTVNETSAATAGSRMFTSVKVQEHIRSLCARVNLSREFIAHEIARETRKTKRTKTKQVLDNNGQIHTLTSVEEIDRTPALTLAADILGMRKGPEVAGVTVHVHMGAELGLDESPPVDVTPSVRDAARYDSATTSPDEE